MGERERDREREERIIKGGGQRKTNGEESAEKGRMTFGVMINFMMNTFT